MALVANGTAGGREQAAEALAYLARNNAANRASIIQSLVAVAANGQVRGATVAMRHFINRNFTHRMIAEALVVAANGNYEQIVRTMKALPSDSSNRAECGGARGGCRK